MKTSIIITAIMLIVAATFGWHHHQQLVSLRAENAGLVEDASALGKSRKGEGRSRLRERQDEDALAAEFIAFAREGGKLLGDGVGPDAETTKRSVELIDRMMRLNASQMESFLSEFRAELGINELARKHMLMDCVLALSTRSPRAGLELFIHSPELLGEGSITKQYIGELLGNLAKDDPQSALEWLGASGLPEEVVRDRAYNLSAGWTERDYQAVGKWLASAPDSPGKSAAVGAFAAKVHPFEPEIAMQWLKTLPQGPDRSKALEAIHRGMQENQSYEKAAVEAFAREHGFSK
jgi:hypothetical protein